MATRPEILELTSLTAKGDGATYAVGKLSIQCSVGGGSDARFSVIGTPGKKLTITQTEGSPELEAFKVDEVVTISVSMSPGGSRTLYTGVVVAVLDAVQSTAQAYGVAKEYVLKSLLNKTSRFALGNLLYVNRANDKTALASPVADWSMAWADAAAYTPDTDTFNVAAYVINILDNKPYSEQPSGVTTTVSTSLRSLIDVAKAPRLILAADYQQPVRLWINNMVASGYASMPPLQLLLAVLQQFYLTLVHTIPGDGSKYAAKVIVDNPWTRTISSFKSTPDNTISITSNYTNSYLDDINGVVADWTEVSSAATQQGMQKPEGSDICYIGCGEYLDKGQPRRWAGDIELRQDAKGKYYILTSNGLKINTPRFKKIPLPGWLSGLGLAVTAAWGYKCKDYAACIKLAKNYTLMCTRYAAAMISRKGSSITCTVPLSEFLKARDFIGTVCYIQTGKSKSTAYYGRLESVSLSIQATPSLHISCVLTFAYVRTEQEQQALGITNFLYKGWS